ncbi:hypothetical protein [Deinococcus saxicola]|uniref:hypothetical protein n=1 Tax=Deinococcus saxicola TaxID=249406 RepID=UPI0039EE08E3
MPPEQLIQALTLVQRASKDLWPGFIPATIPTLVFDGDDTWLGGTTPATPGWEASLSGWRWRGRHPALVANTAVTLPDGSTAAGILLRSLGTVSAERLASLVIHEAFHVWQAAHPSPAWEANELDALTYPAGDAEVLHARAEETACLGAALNKPDWQGDAAKALAWRAVRHGLLSARQREYEQRAETLEGLAQFVECQFLKELPLLDPLAAVGLGIRPWAYFSGAASAFLLSRGGESWQAEVMSGTPLDSILAGQIGTSDRMPEITPALAEAAAHAAQAHTLRLEHLRQQFDALPGKRLRLSGSKLRVVGFDPLNIHALPDGQLLHTRYVAVEVGDGRLEVLTAQALADGADLLNPTALTVADMTEPSVSGGRWQIRTVTLRADLPAANISVTLNGWEASLD